MLPSPYRSISEPLREYITQKQHENPEQFIHLLVGQLAFSTYWEQVLHRNTNLLIDLVLRDMDRVVITSVPYQIDQRAHYEMKSQMEDSKITAEGGELNPETEADHFGG